MQRKTFSVCSLISFVVVSFSAAVRSPRFAKNLGAAALVALLVLGSITNSFAVCATGDVICQGGEALTVEITRVFNILLPFAISVMGLFIGWKLIKKMVKSGIGG